MSANPININNRKAGFEYELLQKFEAGMLLTGSEIKSIRQGKVNMGDAYCSFAGPKLVVRNLHISAYKEASWLNHEPMRDRQLLLNKQELKKLLHRTKEKGLTIVPTRLYINERGYAKLEIALARGKKMHDKRDSVKERDMKRDMERE
ncbi:MAG: SsrA-binding protein SmpB [Bacteroidia bacterium]